MQRVEASENLGAIARFWTKALRGLPILCIECLPVSSFNHDDTGRHSMSEQIFSGFGVMGYRSFGGDEIERVITTNKINLLVGRNNAGKSNLLKFLHDVVGRVNEDGSIQDINATLAGRLDLPDGWTDASARILSVGVNLTEASHDLLGRSAASAQRPDLRPLLQILSTPAFSPDGSEGITWFDFNVATQAGANVGQLVPSRAQLDEALRHLENVSPFMPTQLLANASMSLLSRSSSDDYSNFSGIVQSWRPWKYIPEMAWVDAVREVTNQFSLPNGVQRSGTRNGRGLVEDLALLQRPAYISHVQDTAKYGAFLEFVRAILQDDDADVVIPDDKSEILVLTGGILKPLEGMGTGIGEVLVLAAACATRRNALICIEEPELHLHPALQRRLIQFLWHSTENRYVISTHSAALLDSELSSISHVAKIGGWSRVGHVRAPKELASAVADLGNRASDLVQSNFVIWVEGPSDRIYIASWLSFVAPELIEGAHYSIMFYGGALLSHLTARDEEVNDFIKLARINRNFSIVIDSDKKSASDGINATKIRVSQELADFDGIVWITAGYTIENYIPAPLLSECIHELYSIEYLVADDAWTSPLSEPFQGKSYKPSKVTVARAVVRRGGDWINDQPDLLAKLTSLSEAIVRANHM